MAGNRIDTMDLKQLIRLKCSGMSNRKIATSLGISRNTVNQYTCLFQGHQLEYEQLLTLSDKDLDDLFSATSEVDTSRFAELAQYFEYFGRELKKLGCTKEALWKSYRSKHPEGYGLSQFNHHVNGWLARVNGSTKLEHKVGDKLYIDFSGKKLSYVDKNTGELIAVEVFVAILPASQYTYVCAVNSQSTDDLVEALNGCLSYLGGVPRAIVPDNLKAAVIKAHKYEPKINPTLRDFAQHYGCVISPTRSYSPQDKALVENAVNIVYKRIFYPLNTLTFFSIKELNAEIQTLLESYNDQLFARRNTTRRQEFLAIEREHLSPLPASPYQIRHFKQLTVQKMGFVYLSNDKHYYSVPYRLIGKKVAVMYGAKTVEVFYEKQRVALHKRDYTLGAYSTQKEHLSSAAKAWSEWSLPYFQDRAKTIGSCTCQYISELIQDRAHPEQGYKQAQGILMLAKQHTPQRVEQACQRASSLTKRAYHIVETMLKNGMEKEESLSEEILSTLHNPNVRGPSYFH